MSAAAGILLAALNGSAFTAAQAAPSPPPAADDQHVEIVVTAQRRPEQAADVPISLTALSGADLERAQATDMAGLGKLAPSLVMIRTGAFTQPYLRGIGKRSTLGVENGVATYVDGVYLASSISALLDLRGVERVEVLNGPQGTLFGRNSTGGVIQVITRDPAFNGRAGEASLSFGTYGFLRGDTYLTAGNEDIAGNIAASLATNGGYGTNVFTGKKDQGEIDHSLVLRSKWIWRPRGAAQLTLAADYQDIDQDFSQRPVDGFPPVGEPRVLGFRDGDQDSSNRFHFRYGGISLKAEFDIGIADFISLTAGRRMFARYGTDLDQGPQLLLSGEPVAKQDQFSQEFQLRSRETSSVDWLAGLYYIHLDERYDPTLFRYGGSYSDMLGGRVLQTLFSRGKVSSYAAYGEATFPIGRSTRLTAGARYTIERRSVRASGERLFDTAPLIRPIPGLPLPTEEPYRESETFRELTWRATLDHHFNDDIMGYVSASRGFQSGGWNLQSPQSPAFEPESLIALETGLKVADRTGRFSADASIFYYDYADLQVSAFTPLGSVTTNAASAELYGMAVQFRARAGRSTDLRFGGQLLHARYGRFPNATCADYAPDAPVRYAPISCDVSGNRLPFAPKLKFNVGVDQHISLGASGKLMLSGNLAYNGGYYSEPDNVVEQTAFATVDLSAEWKPAANGLSIRLWALNVTDADYYDSLVTFPTTGVLQRPATPRRLGASLTYTL